MSGRNPFVENAWRTRVLPFIVIAALLAVLPFVFSSRASLSMMNLMGASIVFALSYNMLLGQSGLLSFGHAVYFGFGGYAAMHAMNWIELAEADGGLWAYYPPFFLPIVGFAGGLLAGVVFGYPSCKRAGVPFAMISLGIAELVAAAGFMFVSVFGGEEGISGNRMNGPVVFGLSLGPIDEVYWFIAFWTVVGTVGVYAVSRTPLGRMANAVRDNPVRVQFVGYNPERVRFLMFMLSGGFAGLAGGMSAVNFEIFTPESLGLAASGLVLIMAYIGGIRYFWGPILGAVVITYMQSNLSDYSEAWLFYLGLLFIAIVMFAPRGLAGILADAWEASRRPGFARVAAGWAVSGLGILVGFLGVVVLVEVNFRRAAGYGDLFTPFGIPLPPDAWYTWVIGIGLLALGALIHLRLKPALTAERGRLFAGETPA